MDRNDHRFVLRVWREPSAAPPGWRGSVYEVATTLSIVSDKLPDLWDFIALRLDELRQGDAHGDADEG
jgi:hypothetical protein